MYEYQHCHMNLQAAVVKLEAARAAEDDMSYMEPPRLWQPIRQCLGFVHLNATGDHAAAERVSHPCDPPVCLPHCYSGFLLVCRICRIDCKAGCRACLRQMLSVALLYTGTVRKKNRIFSYAWWRPTSQGR